MNPGFLSARIPALSTTLYSFQNQILSLLLRSAAVGGLMVEPWLERKRYCLNTWYSAEVRPGQGSRVEGFGQLGAARGLWAHTLAGKDDEDKRGQGHCIFVLGSSSVKWGSWFIHSNPYQPYSVLPPWNSAQPAGWKMPPYSFSLWIFPCPPLFQNSIRGKRGLGSNAA